VVEQYPQQVKVVFKNFPLRNHSLALPAARAALAAYNQGKFWEYHDKLFAAGKGLNEALFSQIAEQLQLDMERFEQDRNGRAGYEQVAADYRLGQSVEVRGTPALFVNGKLLDERSPEAFKAMIDRELQR